MTWVVFADRASFDAYHLAACTAHSVPRPGRNQQSSVPAILNTWTQGWVDIFGAFVASPNSFLLVNVPPEDVAAFALTLAQNDPVIPFPSGTRTIVWNGVARTIFSVAKDWLQPKPVTWTDPVTGLVYNTTTGAVV